jgi:hypothetical protein
MHDLEAFIVHAKAQTYVGGGAFREPCRPGSHDVGFEDGEWSYLDSYFGGTDFIGQEVVWRSGEPVWAMNYYGRILEDSLIDAAKAGSIIKRALSAMYREGRFLGGFEWKDAEATYVDWSDGDVGSFRGFERIFMGREEVYRLDYGGGLIRR